MDFLDSPNATIPIVEPSHGPGNHRGNNNNNNNGGGSGGVNLPLIVGLATTLGSIALLAIFFAVVYFLFYTRRGRILLHRGRPGEYDDEQSFLREEEEGLQQMDDIARASYFQARAFVEVNPPDSVPTDISLSQFMAIQEKGVSAWEFEPDFENANCFVEARTEIAFYDSECCVMTNLPVPKQNDVYYWEAKLYDKPEQTLVAIGLCTKPYPTFRMPGYHRYSVAYNSLGERRNNQPFHGVPYGPLLQQGDVIGVGFKPRTGTVFFTRNGKKLEDAAHGMKLNLFPTIGANGPCTVHVNFGQAGFVFIEANVKKWGLAPVTGSLAPPPPYGAEQGSVLLEIGRFGRDYGSTRNSAPVNSRNPQNPFSINEASTDHGDSIDMSNFTIVDPSSSTAVQQAAASASSASSVDFFAHPLQRSTTADSSSSVQTNSLVPLPSNVSHAQRIPSRAIANGRQRYVPPSNRPPSYHSDVDEQEQSSETAALLGRSPPPAFEESVSSRTE